MSTQKQVWMYRAEWKKTRDALRAYGWSSAECELKRKAIHVEARAVDSLGVAKSSLDLINPELTNIFALFWVWSQPGNLEAQQRQQQTWPDFAARLLDACGVEPHGRAAYLDAICQRIFKFPLDQLTEKEWPAILGALNHTRQHKQGIAHSHRTKAAAVAGDDSEPF